MTALSCWKTNAVDPMEPAELSNSTGIFSEQATPGAPTKAQGPKTNAVDPMEIDWHSSTKDESLDETEASFFSEQAPDAPTKAQGPKTNAVDPMGSGDPCNRAGPFHTRRMKFNVDECNKLRNGEWVIKCLEFNEHFNIDKTPCKNMYFCISKYDEIRNFSNSDKTLENFLLEKMDGPKCIISVKMIDKSELLYKSKFEQPWNFRKSFKNDVVAILKEKNVKQDVHFTTEMSFFYPMTPETIPSYKAQKYPGGGIIDTSQSNLAIMISDENSLPFGAEKVNKNTPPFSAKKILKEDIHTNKD